MHGIGKRNLQIEVVGKQERSYRGNAEVSKTTVKTHYTRVIAAGITSWDRT